MRSTLISFVALAAFATACGGGRVAQVPDAGTPLPQGKCLDSDGDGIPGTGDCSEEPIVDCNDQDPNVYPGQTETCNAVDDNCNAQVDEGLSVVAWYSDADKDGYGASRVGEGCGAAPAGAVTQSGDCNDNDATVHPGAAELCNAVDDDCDGTADNGLPFQSFYADADHDGFGDPTSTATRSCQTTLTG